MFSGSTSPQKRGRKGGPTPSSTTFSEDLDAERTFSDSPALNKASRRAEALHFLTRPPMPGPPVPLPSPTSLPLSLLSLLTASALSRAAASPRAFFLPYSAASPLTLIAHVSSKPQLRAVVAGLKADAAEWSLHVADATDQAPKPGNKQLPAKLLARPDLAADGLAPAEKEEWQALPALYPAGILPTGMTGAGPQPRGSRSVYDSGWVAVSFGGLVAVHVMTENSRELFDLEEKIGEEGGEEVDLGGVVAEFEGGGAEQAKPEAEDVFWS
ncbi:hypothetical protein TeGR_g3101 [Tetraparma gracilis]|uniref:Uncharacterized protein n=1 Tax=Tetraparma gracilis TaxID=2962635 RepID=A0ABQ6MH55_9STRA|nr:hypothetical protein TeGR_g3101 [Tetraparma gracilis]